MKLWFNRYKLAPKNPFPIALEECYKIAKYVTENPEEFEADLNKLIFAGDSAG